MKVKKREVESLREPSMKNDKYQCPNWSELFPKNLEKVCKFKELRSQCVYFLEIGVLEARTAHWALKHILTHSGSRYYGIDNWEFCITKNDSGIKDRAYKNIARWGDKACLFDGNSFDILSKFIADGMHGMFDIAYIDGDHTAYGVMADSILVWPLLKGGGVLIWDDAKWGRSNKEEHDRPELAIGTFRRMIRHQHTELFNNNQIGIKKN